MKSRREPKLSVFLSCGNKLTKLAIEEEQIPGARSDKGSFGLQHRARYAGRHPPEERELGLATASWLC